MDPATPTSLSSEAYLLLQEMGIRLDDPSSSSSATISAVTTQPTLSSLPTDQTGSLSFSDFQSITAASLSAGPQLDFDPDSLLNNPGSPSQPATPESTSQPPPSESKDILSNAMQLHDIESVLLPDDSQKPGPSTQLTSTESSSQQMSVNEKMKLHYMLGDSGYTKAHYDYASMRPKKRAVKKQPPPVKKRKKPQKEFESLETELLFLALQKGTDAELDLLKPDLQKFTVEKVQEQLDQHPFWASDELKTCLDEELADFIHDICEWKGVTNTLEELINTKMQERNLDASLLKNIRSVRANVCSNISKSHQQTFDALYTQKLKDEIARLQALEDSDQSAIIENPDSQSEAMPLGQQ
ncbi:hypothetical protein [Endozoicomonas arenosclerae]|uniref:hypothetical protein n=1 Tax=Endozoicomonas arenosclerae TaxID=1633495 RepID=UPI000782914C|nr:hypothetical protein [Endozoicomonas arenosclerae]